MECYVANKNNMCAAEACNSETTFINNLVELLSNMVSPNLDLQHDEGFDTSEKCQSSQGQDAPASKECCGPNFQRFPYRTDGERQCCGVKTYNSVVLECCADDSVQPIC